MRMQSLQQTWKISATILYIRFHIRYEDKGTYCKGKSGPSSEFLAQSSESQLPKEKEKVIHCNKEELTYKNNWGKNVDDDATSDQQEN